MNEERASGAIIVSKREEHWHVLCIKDRNGKITFPKGHIEHNETTIEAAIREAQEETGISGLIHLAPLSDVSYMYSLAGVTIHKTVQYHLFTCEGLQDLVPQKEEGILNVMWIPLDRVRTKLGYPTSYEPIIDEVTHTLSL